MFMFLKKVSYVHIGCIDKDYGNVEKNLYNLKKQFFYSNIF